MIRAVVVAFDGVFAATLETRVRALADALASHGADVAAIEASAIAGRTFAEAARSLGVADETTVDLVSLTAERTIEELGARGWPVDPMVLLSLRRDAAAGRRLALRADATRRTVERTLAVTGAGELFSLVRCSDDLPRLAGVASLESSWAAIDRRLTAFGIGREGRLALEPAAAMAVASCYALTSSSPSADGAHEPERTS